MLDSSKLKQSADDNFKFDENGKKFSKGVETTVGNGEIACYKQFLFFPQCFQKTCTADLFGKGLKKDFRLQLNFNSQQVNYYPEKKGI